MGAAPSTAEPAVAKATLQRNEHEVVKLMMPVYFSPFDVTLEERSIASASWDLILNDKSPEFLANKGKPDFKYQTCVTFFYDSFYYRLFDVHPLCRPLFKSGMKAQGKFLVKMISLALCELDNPETFDNNLAKLAEVHFQRGVKTVEYGIVGEVLFWCLKRCLGASSYTQKVHAAWVKVYSRMLRTVIPVAVAYELKGKSESQMHRITMRDTMAFSSFADRSSAPEDDIEEENLESEKIRRAEPVNQKF